MPDVTAVIVDETTGRKAVIVFDPVYAYEKTQPRWPDGRWKRKGVFSRTKNWLGEKMRMSGIQRKGESKTPVMLLDATGHPDMARYKAPDMGRFLVPDMYDAAKPTQADGVPIGVDNGGYNEFNPEKSPEKRAAIHANWEKMIQALHDQGIHPLWVTVPDVLRWPPEGGPPKGDAAATIKRWPEGKKRLDELGLPAAFVAQDGMDSPENLKWLDDHWDEIDGIFIGGSDDFKLGPGAYKITQLAHKHGKLVHVGRVNSKMRISYVRDVMHADSFDGQQWAKFKRLTLADGLEHAASGDAPPQKVGKRWLEAAIKARDGKGPWPKPPQMNKKPQWRGYFPRGVTAAAAGGEEEGVLYYAALADALYEVGLSDYRNLIFDAEKIGFTVEADLPEQIGWLVDLLGLPAPEVDGDRANWPSVLIVPGDPPEEEAAQAEGMGAVAAYDPKQKRWPPGSGKKSGRWMETGGGGEGVLEVIGGTDVSPDEFWSLYDKIEELRDPRTDVKEIRTSAGHRITVDPEYPGKVTTTWGGEEKIEGGKLIVEFPDLESWRRGNPETILEKAKEMGDVKVRKDGTVRDRSWGAKEAADMVAQMTPGEAIRVPIDKVEVHGQDIGQPQTSSGGTEHVAVTTPFAPGTVYNGEWLKPEAHPLVRRAVRTTAGTEVGRGGEKFEFQEQRLNPDTPLYHVSANLPEVRRDGYLTVGQGGGLGAFGKEDSVSFTLNGDAVPVMVGDLKRHIRLAKALPDPPPSAFNIPSIPPKGYKGTIDDYRRDVINPAIAARVEWSEEMLGLLRDEAKTEGWDFNAGSFQSSQLESYDFGDWLTQYYTQRPAEKGGNPLYLGISQDDQRHRDEKNIGAIRTTLKDGQNIGALMTFLWSEDEIRLYGDVPMNIAQVVA